MSTPLKLKFKLSTSAPRGGSTATTTTNSNTATVTGSGEASAQQHHRSLGMAAAAAQQQQPLLVGARGGAALKDLLSTAPNPEVAIRDFQSAHGLSWSPPAPAVERKSGGKAAFTPAVQLLDLLAVQRSSVYTSLLDKLLQEMLLRIDELPQEELQRVLEVTFPYIEFRELRAIPIAILSRQEETPEVYLRELTENRKILNELPVHVRRKIMHVDPQELHIFVEQCTQEYVEHMTDWYLKHPGQQTTSRNQGDSHHHHTATNVDSSIDLWNVTSHMPSSSSSSSSSSARHSRWGLSPEERRRSSSALAKLTEMLGDSESLYLATVDILKEYVIAANIPGSTNSNPKEYVDYVPFLGALRSDLANIQRDKTTALLRTDPLHKFIWFLDRAMKNQTLETSQLHELLGFIGKLRTGDLPPNKKFKKKSSGAQASEIQEEEENFEIVLGPPPVDELLSLLDKIAKSDVRMIFAEPVPDDVPKYREIIKEPMDLSTMRKKAKRGKYKSVEMFTDDFNLMIRNCMTFNPDTTVFYKEGKRVGKRGNELIEKNMIALRGEPQRIRAKKRRKVGPSEAVSMLTSTGIATLKDFGDVDQSGMVPEGMCEEMLADTAMILSDPHVKQLLCDALMKNLVLCWQKRELPTDNLICRGIVQLLQIGNPSSVRRMIRKKDFVLRAPQVVTMRVVLPLLLRSMVTNRVYFAFPPSFQRDTKAKEDLLDTSLWENVLRASSAIRTMTKAFTVQCLVDHQIDLGAQLLQYVLAAEDDLLLRDRPFLHAVGEVVLEQIKASLSGSGDHHSDAHASPASERLKSLSAWKLVVRDFFLSVLEQRIHLMKETMGSVVTFFEVGETAADGDDASTGEKNNKAQSAVKAFPVPVFHEKTVMLLTSVLNMTEKADSSSSSSSVTEEVVSPFVKRTLGALRSCCASLDEFKLLWSSRVFRSCREFYEQLLAKCPVLKDELFSSTESASASVANGQVKKEETGAGEERKNIKEDVKTEEQEEGEEEGEASENQVKAEDEGSDQHMKTEEDSNQKEVKEEGEEPEPSMKENESAQSQVHAEVVKSKPEDTAEAELATASGERLGEQADGDELKQGAEPASEASDAVAEKANEEAIAEQK